MHYEILIVAREKQQDVCVGVFAQLFNAVKKTAAKYSHTRNRRARTKKNADSSARPAGRNDDSSTRRDRGKSPVEVPAWRVQR